MKCNCGSTKGGTIFTCLYQGNYPLEFYDDWHVSFKCNSCGNYAEATGPNQELAKKALEREWNKLMESTK